MAKPKPPVPVLVVDSVLGIPGIRRSGARMVLNGMVVVSAASGPRALPADLTPSELHAHMGTLNSPLQVQWREEIVEALFERMGIVEHAHFAEPGAASKPGQPIGQTCRCGLSRTRERGLHPWGDWS